MKQRVSLLVEIDPDWTAGARLQLYTDQGTGTVDDATGLLRRPVEVWPGFRPTRGFGLDPFARREVFTGRPPTRRGCFNAPFAQYPFCQEPGFRRLEVTIPAAYANWMFAAEATDLVGNAQDAALNDSTAMVSGTEPPAVHSFAFYSWDNANSQITFTFTPGVES